MKNYSFHLILLSIVLGILGGMYFPQQMMDINWIGVLFLNMLKLIVLPLIFSALVSAIASIGDVRKLGTVGAFTFGYIILSVSVAVFIGLVLFNIFSPGVGIDPHLITAGENGKFASVHSLSFVPFIESLFPSNIIEAAVKFEIMPIVLFSIAFAVACIAVGDSAKPVVDFFSGLRNIFVKMIMWLMHLTPLGLFSLLGAAVAETIKNDRLAQSITGMGLFILVFLLGLLLQVLWQLAVVKYVAKRNATQYLKTASNAMVTAFATSSSIATLPVAMQAAKEQGVSDEVSRFVLPFATTINLAGTAMYEAVAAMFFCQILGIELSVSQQIGVFIVAIVAGMGATGIPEGGLVTMVTVLRAVNIPTSAIALLLPFDRILDRFRTMTNVWGDLACAATVDAFAKKHKTSKSTKLAEIASAESMLARNEPIAETLGADIHSK